MRQLGTRASMVVTMVSVGLLMACAAPSDRDPSGATPTATGTATPSASPTEYEVTGSPVAISPTTAPTIEVRTVTETQSIAFQTTTINDPSMTKGKTVVRTEGVAGTMTLTYEVTFTNGVQTSKKLVRQVVTKAPTTKITVVGTKAQRQCDPNYSGACVPIASDVDCAGGGGNGPAYVQGPVRVIGSDIYDLDRDGDGIGCEAGR